jgi:hypothetical protein
VPDGQFSISQLVSVILWLGRHAIMYQHWALRLLDLVFLENLIRARLLTWSHHHEMEVEILLIKLRSLWARMWRRTRLAKIEWSTRAILGGMSTCLKKTRLPLTVSGAVGTGSGIPTSIK